MNTLCKLTIGTMVLAAAMTTANAADDDRPVDHPSVKRAVDFPPSADLAYTISARQRGFALSGDATLTWRVGEGKYAVNTESRVAMLGKLTEDRSTGLVDAYGLAPVEYYEKRFRKDATTTTFDRDGKTVGFSDAGRPTYPLKGGEQDRVSIAWQLTGIARAAKAQFKPGAEFAFFVVGPRDADPWTFRVVGRDKVQLGPSIGEVEAVHVMRAPPPGSKEQTLDIWLAPSQEWYPVKLKFTDNDRDYVEQVLEKVTRK